MLKKRFRSAKQVDGVIDLERLRSGSAKCIERAPDKFLELTYPSEDLHAMLRALTRRFSGNQPEGEGLVVAEAVKGLGKSHALLTAYHLFASAGPARRWMTENGYDWNPPQDPLIIIKKFTDYHLPFDSLWTVLDEELKAGWSQTTPPPNLDEVRSALGSRHLILIFDELERGISNIVDSARRSQNLSFLQMLSEEANRNLQVTLFAAIYDGTVEPGSTLKRITPRVELRFRNPEDRAAIVRHRLFANANSYDRSAADALIRSYINAWKGLGINATDGYLVRMRDSFPFLPELIELIFERISGTVGFQGTRGALGLLGSMIDAEPSGSYLLTAGHARLSDSACADRLQDLDPAGNLINCAQRNYQDLKNQPHAEAMASAVLLASLAPGVKGLSREELVRHVATPGNDPNRFESTLQTFRMYGSYFHEREGRFFFDLEENENAKVEIEAIHLPDDRAREEVKAVWKQDLFREMKQAVIMTDLEATKTALDQLPKNTLRFILSPRRLSSFERHGIYFRSELRNQIILLEPRDETVNILTNPDILASAKRAIAADSLVPSAGTAERRNRYERISQQERKNTINFIKSAGLVYIRVENWGETSEETTFEIEPLGQNSEKQSVLEYIRRQLFPAPFFIDHLKDRLDSFYGKAVSQVERIYRSTLGFPVPVKVPDVSDAIVALVQDRDRILGLEHQKGRFCGEYVALRMGELPDAILTPPWPAGPVSDDTGLPRPGPQAPEPGPSDSFPRPGMPGPSPLTEEKGTPYCHSLGELRQAVAEKLSNVEGPVILSARFQIFARYENANLGDLPSALRGGLTENGDLDAQLDLNIPGPMDKAKLEGLCESLPNLPGGRYMARLSISGRQEKEDYPLEDSGEEDEPA